MQYEPDSTQQAAGSGIRYFSILRVPFCFLLSAFCFLFLFSCKTQEKVGTVEIGNAKAHNEFFDSMQKQAFQFNTLSARANVELNIPGREMSSRVDVRMVRDSAFLLSVQPFLGIEVFRVEFNTDSVKVIDRMNKRYVAESYEGLKGETPVTFNFYNLQAMFTNRIFIPGERAIEKRQYNRFKLKQDGATAEIRIKDAMDLLYTFMADGEEKLLSTYVTDRSEKYALQWLYRDFRLTGGQPFPMMMDVNLQKEGVSAGGIKMNFSKIETDVPVNMENSIPVKYKRITFAQIIKGITGK